MVIGIDGPPVTMSYQSSMLSTLEYRSDGPPATKAMDFADLPCPPSEVAEVYNPEVPYFPILVPTFGAKWNLFVSPDNQTNLAEGPLCETAAIMDPPVYAHRVRKISGAEDGSGTIP